MTHSDSESQDVLDRLSSQYGATVVLGWAVSTCEPHKADTVSPHEIIETGKRMLNHYPWVTTPHDQGASDE